MKSLNAFKVACGGYLSGSNYNDSVPTVVESMFPVANIDSYALN